MTAEQIAAREAALQAKLEAHMDADIARARAIVATAPDVRECLLCRGAGNSIGCPCCGGSGAFDRASCACPPCFRQHSGWMLRAAPNGPDLEPPVEITRCVACRRAWHADGTLHDERARAALWAAHRRAQEAAEAGLFAESEAA